MTGIVICLSLLSILPSNDIYTLNIVGNVAHIMSGILIYTLPRFSHSTVKNRDNKKNDLLFLSISGTFVTLQLFSIIFLQIPYISHIIMCIMGGAIVYSMIYMISANKGNPGVVKGNHYILLGLLTLIFLPIMFLIDFFPGILNVPQNISNGFSIYPGFYLLLNLGFISALKGHLFIKPQSLNVFYEKYNITTREREVLKLLSNGLSYKLIAVELHISLSTVKTHVSRLYQKTETTNKLEIIDIMHKSYKSTT